MKRLLISLIPILFAISGESQAASTTCDGCTQYEKEIKAEMLAAHGNLPYYEPIYVIDNTTGVVKKFYVSLSDPNQDVENQIGDGSTSYGVVIEDPVEQDVIIYGQLVIQSQGYRDFIPGQIPGVSTVYDVIDSPSAQRQISAQLKGAFTHLVQMLHEYGGRIKLLPVDLKDFKIVISVNIGSGAIDFRWNPETKEYEPIQGSYRDSDLNTVPQSKDDITGGIGNIRRYTFTNPENLWSFIDRVHRLNGSFTGTVTVGTIECKQEMRPNSEGQLVPETICKPAY